MITVSIGGVNRPYLVPGSASIQWAKRGRSTARFKLRDVAGEYRPTIGSPVVLTDGTTTFRGLVTGFTEMRDEGILRSTSFDVHCRDYGAILDRRFVARRYPALTLASTIYADLVATYLSGEGFNADGMEGFAQIPDDLVFDYRPLAECLSQITDLTGEDWWIGGSDGKHLYATSLVTAPEAPFAIAEGSLNWRDLSTEYDSRAYRNRQHVRTAVSLGSGAVTETFTGNGSQWFFATQFVLNEAPTVTVGGVAQAVYRYGVDPYPAAGWFWIPGGSGVQQGTQTAPGVGVAIVVAYPSGGYTSNVITRDNSAEQAARAAIEGGSGIWESVEDARNVDNLTIAETLGDGLLDRYGEFPQTINYETDHPGLEIGMAQEATLPANGIGGETLGPELVINGTFDDDTGWTLSGTLVSEGKLNVPGVGTAGREDAGITAGHTYRVSFTLSDYGYGHIYVQLGGTTLSAARSGDGAHTFDMTVESVTAGGVVIGGDVFNARVDNFSVKRISYTASIYYVTAIESRAIERGFNLDSGIARPDNDGYHFRHRVSLSSGRDQTAWLQWLASTLAAAKTPDIGGDTTIIEGGTAVDVPDVTNVICGAPFAVQTSTGWGISIPTTFNAPSPLGEGDAEFSAYELHYQIDSGEGVSLGVLQAPVAAGDTIIVNAVIPYQYAACVVNVYPVSRSAVAADALNLDSGPHGTVAWDPYLPAPEVRVFRAGVLDRGTNTYALTMRWDTLGEKVLIDWVCGLPTIRANWSAFAPWSRRGGVEQPGPEKYAESDFEAAPSSSLRYRRGALAIEITDPVEGEEIEIVAVSYDRYGQPNRDEFGNVTGPTVTLLVPAPTAVVLAPPGPVQNVTHSDPEFTEQSPNAKIRIKVNYDPPATLNGFDRVPVYVEAPDQSAGGTGLVAGGTIEADSVALGEWKPEPVGTFPHVAGKPIVLEVPQPHWPSESWRFYIGSANALAQAPLVRAGQTGATPSFVVTVEQWTAAAATGVEYAPLIVRAGILTARNEVINVDGKLKRLVSFAFTEPTDSRYAGVTIEAVDSFGNVLNSIDFGRGQVGGTNLATIVVDEPATVGKLRYRFLSYSAAGTNAFVSGITPVVEIDAGTDAGVIDLRQILLTTIAAHLGVTSGVFGVLPSGITETLIANAAVTTNKIVDEAVGTNKIAPFATTAAKIANAAIQNAHFDRATANKIAIINADIVDLAAAKINAGTLAAGVIYTGTINANQVNAGLFNGHSLILNKNGVTTTIDNIFDGLGYIGIEVAGNVSGWRGLLWEASAYFDVGGVQTAAVGSLYSSGGIVSGGVKLNKTSGSDSCELTPVELKFNGTKVMGPRQTVASDTLANLYTACRTLGFIA